MGGHSIFSATIVDAELVQPLDAVTVTVYIPAIETNFVA